MWCSFESWMYSPQPWIRDWERASQKKGYLLTLAMLSFPVQNGCYPGHTGYRSTNPPTQKVKQNSKWWPDQYWLLTVLSQYHLFGKGQVCKNWNGSQIDVRSMYEKGARFWQNGRFYQKRDSSGQISAYAISWDSVQNRTFQKVCTASRIKKLKSLA